MAEQEKINIETKNDLQDWVDNTDKVVGDIKQSNEELEKELEKKATQMKALEDEIEYLSEQQANQVLPEKDDMRKLDIEIGKWWVSYRKRLGLFNDKARASMKKISTISDERLKINPKYLKTDPAKADLGTPVTGDASGTDGQYLIPQIIYDTQIIRTMEVASEVIPLFTRKTMTGRLHRFPVENDVATLTYVTNEVTDKTESNPDWTKVDLECETFATWIGVTDEFEEDTFADLGAQIRVQVMENYQNTVESQMLEGSGSPFTGVLGVAGTQSHTMDTNAFANLDWDDMQLVINKLTTRKLKQGAVFMMHPTIWDILTNAQDAHGQYYFRPDLAGPRTCKGIPVKLTDNMPQLSDSAADTAFIIYGNPKWLFYGIRMGLEFRYFDQTFYAVQDDENFWRARTRFACKIALPGNYAVVKTKA